MSAHSVDNTDSDGEDFFTCSIQSDDLSRTIRDMGCLMTTDAVFPEMSSQSPIDGAGLRTDRRHSEYDLPADWRQEPCSPLMASILWPSTDTPMKAVWSLPEGCGDAALAALMRTHLVLPANTALASAHSAETATKLSSYTACAALAGDPLAPGSTVPPLFALIEPPSEEARSFPRFEQLRRWLHADRDGEEPLQPVPPPPRASEPTRLTESLLTGRLAVPSLGSILLGGGAGGGGGKPTTLGERSTQPDSARHDGSCECPRVSVGPDDNASFRHNASVPSFDKSQSLNSPLTGDAHSPMLTSDPSRTVVDRSDIFCVSPLRLDRPRQDSCRVESVLPPIALPPAQTSTTIMENSFSIKSPSLVAHNVLTASFGSPMGVAITPAPRGSGDSRGGGRAKTSKGLFNRLFSPKRAGEGDFTTRETVTCGAGSPRSRGRSAPDTLPARAEDGTDAPLPRVFGVSSTTTSGSASPMLSRQRSRTFQ